MESNASLPYGMLLTKIFKAKGVELNKTPYREVDATYDAMTMKLMRHKCVDGKWVRMEK